MTKNRERRGRRSTTAAVVAAIVLLRLTTPAPAAAQPGCDDESERWEGLRVCAERGSRSGYQWAGEDTSLEDEIIASSNVDRSAGQVYGPYACRVFDISTTRTASGADANAIVHPAEAYDSGLGAEDVAAFGRYLDNLTLATAQEHEQKRDLDAAGWKPSRNQGWFAETVLEVKRRWNLSVDPAERRALMQMRGTTDRDCIEPARPTPALPAAAAAAGMAAMVLARLAAKRRQRASGQP